MELVTVSPTEVITSEHTNDLRDRTVQRYDDLATRASENPTPTAGDLAFMEDTGETDIYFGGAWRHIGSPVGTIIDHGGGSVPAGWLACNGAEVSRTTYAGLFAQIGEIWGEGDGSTTFNLPDLRERVTRGVAAAGDGDAVGDLIGADTHAHSGPSHVHSGPSHAHTNPNVNAGGDHSHTTDPVPHNSGSMTVGTFIQGGSIGASHLVGDHSHVTDIVPTASSTNGSHAHSQGNTGAGGTGATGAGGTGNTGSSSTIQKSAAVNKLIKT